jgi:hypothetical protein
VLGNSAAQAGALDRAARLVMHTAGWLAAMTLAERAEVARLLDIRVVALDDSHASAENLRVCE